MLQNWRLETEGSQLDSGTNKYLINQWEYFSWMRLLQSRVGSSNPLRLWTMIISR
jgi:hypothetical protein